MGNKQHRKIAEQLEQCQKELARLKQGPRPRPHPAALLKHFGEFFAVITGLFGGMLMAEHFWFGVVCAYVSFALLGISLWFAPQLRARRKWRLSFVFSFLTAVIIFTWFFVLTPAPLNVTVLDFFEGVSVGPDGKIGDIPWKKEYYDIRVSVANPTNSDYTDLRMTLETDLFIADVGRFGKCVDGSIETAMHSPLEMRDEVGNRAVGKDSVTLGGITARVPKYNWGWVVKCDKLKRKDALHFVLAVVNVDNSEGLLAAKGPQWVNISGEYLTMGRRIRRFSFRKNM